MTHYHSISDSANLCESGLRMKCRSEDLRHYEYRRAKTRRIAQEAECAARDSIGTAQSIFSPEISLARSSRALAEPHVWSWARDAITISVTSTGNSGIGRRFIRVAVDMSLAVMFSNLPPQVLEMADGGGGLRISVQSFVIG